jgi:hypothetical protein
MVKVEMLKDEQTGTVKLAFESSDQEGLEIVDAVRIAIMSDHSKRGGYVSSSRWVVEIKEDVEKNSA